MRVLIYNQKGGVGKTTTAVNLGAALAHAGAGRVVLADLDPQMHLTAALGVGPCAWDVRHWLAGQPGEPLLIAGEAGLSLVPGAPEIAVAGSGKTPPLCGADWLLIDAAPGWTVELTQLMASADIILCPLEADFLGMQGLNRLLRTMQDAGVSWEKLRLLLTRYSDRLTVHREVRARLAARFGDMLLPVTIRTSVRLAEAPGQGRTIFAHAPSSSGAADYATLADLILSDMQLGRTSSQQEHAK